MVRWAVLFLVIAALGAIYGFGLMPSAQEGLARAIFYMATGAFLAALSLSAVEDRLRRRDGE